MNEIAKKITNKLVELHGSENFTIAFLPYKRSMWDSMQSVYEECEALGKKAYCIPLPYQRIVDGRIESVECEKMLFENSYDVGVLDEVLFDYIVIHYPYDGNNKVTRMLPEYYTSMLCQYGKVVYIPYSCSSMRMLRVQHGIANVDYAFLPSESDADAFINEWKEFDIDFAGRVFGFGSPKMDAIKKCEHLETSSNIALIVNSLAPYLYNPMGKIDAYRSRIMEYMGKGYDVIFRPHPLLRQTIKSMRPDTMGEYIKLIEWAKAIGVYVDETEYIEKALRDADILISDPSSVLEMWQTTGRPYKVL